MIQWQIKEENNIVLVVVYNKVWIWFVIVFLKNIKCELNDIHSKLSFEKPQHDLFYETIYL